MPRVIDSHESKGEEKISYRDMFKQFRFLGERLKIVFVASSDAKCNPTCAPKMLIHIEEPDKVYYVDYKYTNTYFNTRSNKTVSVSFMDDKIFTGYGLNGKCSIVKPGRELDGAKRIWRDRLIKYEADRFLERTKGEFSSREAENILPEDFVIMRIKAKEAYLIKPGRNLRAVRQDSR